MPNCVSDADSAWTCRGFPAALYGPRQRTGYGFPRVAVISYLHRRDVSNFYRPLAHIWKYITVNEHHARFLLSAATSPDAGVSLHKKRLMVLLTGETSGVRYGPRAGRRSFGFFCTSAGKAPSRRTLGECLRRPQ